MRRRILFFSALASFAAVAAPGSNAAPAPESGTPAAESAIPVRNPFWPIGYEGEREIITAAARISLASPVAAEGGDDTETAAAAAAAAAAKAANGNANSQHWIQARKSLAISSPMTIRGADGKRRTCVMINSRTYADGDIVSAVHGSRKFFWRVIGLTDSGVLKLVRVRADRIDAEAETKDPKWRKR